MSDFGKWEKDKGKNTVKAVREGGRTSVEELKILLVRTSFKRVKENSVKVQDAFKSSKKGGRESQTNSSTCKSFRESGRDKIVFFTPITFK